MNDTIPAIGQFIEPSPVTFTFGAPGWYIVAALLVLCILLWAIWVLVRYYKNRYRREAVKRIDAGQEKLFSEAKYADFIYLANMLMKQISMLHYGRKEVASLQGKSWFEYLNSCCRKPIFNTEDENIVATLYLTENNNQQMQAEVFASKAKQWIKNHRYATRNRS